MEKIYRTTVRKLIALVAVLSHGKDMTMTEEDKQLIAAYMGWKLSEWRMIDGSAHVVNPHFSDLTTPDSVFRKYRSGEIGIGFGSRV